MFQKGNPLRACVNKALAALKATGKLAQLQNTWITSKATHRSSSSALSEPADSRESRILGSSGAVAAARSTPSSRP